MTKIERLEKEIKSLPLKERVKLLEKLEKDTAQNNFEKMFNRIDTRVKKYPPITDKEIVKIVKEVRRSISTGE